MKIKFKSITILLLTSFILIESSHGKAIYTTDDLSTEGLTPHYIVAQEGPIFPCDLYGDLPEVTIVGTNHISEDAKDLTDALLISASQGAFYLGQEGLSAKEHYSDYQFDEKLKAKIDSDGIKEYVFGLEDEFFYSIVILGRHLNDMVHMKDKHREISQVAVLLGLTDSLLWKKVFLNIKDEALEDNYSTEMIEAFKLIKLCKNNEEFMTLYPGLKTILSGTSNDEYIELTQHLGRLIIKELNKAYPDYDTTNLSNFFNKPTNKEYKTTFARQDCVLVRDQFFIKNFGKAYCKHYKQGKNFFISVGALHVSDLAKLINEHSAGKIKVTSEDLRNL